MSLLSIRRYEPADWNAVVHLHKIALIQVNAYAKDRSLDEDLSKIEKTYLENNGDFIVGTCERQLIAMGALKKTSTARAEIKRMRVHPDYQRRGFGQAILTALEQRARQLGYTELHLDTTVQQYSAQQFYAKNGYRLIGEGKIAGFDVLFYEKEL